MTGVTCAGPAPDGDPAGQPMFRVVRGAPTDEDLGALVAALLVVARRPGEAAGPGGEHAPGPDVRPYPPFVVPPYAAPGAWARSEPAVGLPWR